MNNPSRSLRWPARLLGAVAGGAALLALSAGPVAAQATPAPNPCRPANPASPRPNPPCRGRGRCYPIGARACSPSITLSDTRLIRNQTFQLTVTGFAPGTLVTFTIDSQVVTLGTAIADQQGRASISVTVPADFPLGRHTVRATGTDDADGDPLVLSQDVTVSAGTSVLGTSVVGTDTTSTAADLARTGMYVVPATAAGLGLIAVGVTLRRSTRRRKTLPA